MLMDSDFSGCFVRGIPVGVPFKCNFSAPEEKKCLYSENIHIFVLLPVSKSEYKDDDNIFNLTDNSESVQVSETINRKGCEVAGLSEIEQETEIDEDQSTGEKHKNSFANISEHEDVTTRDEIMHETSDSKKQELNKPKSQGKKRKTIPDEDWVIPNALGSRLGRNEGKVRRSSRAKASKSIYDGADWYKFDQDCSKTLLLETGLDIEGDSENVLDCDNKHENMFVNGGYKNKTEVDECSIVKANQVDKTLIKIELDDSGTEELKHKDKLTTETADDQVNIQTALEKDSDSESNCDSDMGTEDEQLVTSKKGVKPVKSTRSKDIKTIRGAKRKNRVKVKLEEHEDKYGEEFFPSYARKDRGKSFADCSVKLFVCKVCERFRTEDRLVIENHIEEHVNGDLHCEQCGFIGAYIGDIKIHNRDVHQKNVYVCYKCGKGVVNGRNGIKDHLGKDHDQPQWECIHCRKETGTIKMFALRKLMREHMQKEHSDKMETCNKCKRMFTQKSNLQSHISAGCHGDKPPNSYPCEKCGKSFTTLQQVSHHISTVHSNIRKYQCPQCPFAASKKAGLTLHLHTHTGYHPVRCDRCTFSCVQPYQLKSHMRTHTGEKPYKCSQCEYAAAWKVQLKDHIKVHDLPATVVCEKCSIVFKDARALQNHERKDHSSEIKSKKKSSPKEKHESSAS